MVDILELPNGKKLIVYTPIIDTLEDAEQELSTYD